MPPKARGGKHNGKPRNSKNSNSEFQSSGFKITIPVVESETENINQFVRYHSNLTLPEESISIFKEVIPVKLRGKSLRLNCGRELLKWEPYTTSSSAGILTVKEGGNEVSYKAYQKTIPLIDPYHWMRFKERPSTPFIWKYQKYDIIAPENQGYVDCVASCLVSNLRKILKSPHFCDFYGAFRAVTDVFLYNLEEDLEDFRFTKWFWNGYETGDFGLRVVSKQSGKELSKEEILKEFKPDDEFLHDDEDDDDDNNGGDDDDDNTAEKSSISAQSLEFKGDTVEFETVDLKEVDILDTIPSHEDTITLHKRRNTTPNTIESMTTASDDIDFSEDYTIHAELYQMPVAIQYLEQCEGTMDLLIEMKEYSPILNSHHEEVWIAWLFQVCAACIQLQNSMRLTHNDLHTCNVLWKKTDQEYLYYQTSNGKMFKVPTYGKIFSIIDYGRSIFAVNNFLIISSDYNDGHDASGMYNFGPIEDPDMPRVLPNKSFDLCRLACSLLRGLYPKNPPEKPKGSILTQEGSWKFHETTSELFNLLWVWLRTKQKQSVLETENGQEKYPGFNLYAVIAKDVMDAVPDQQISKTIFNPFLLKTKPDSVNWILIP
jgi:hypothetical protein